MKKLITQLLLLACALIALGVGIYQDVSQPDKKEAHWIEGFAIILAVIVNISDIIITSL